MLRKKVLLVATIAAVLVVPAPVFAHDGSHESEHKGLLDKVEKTVEKTVDSTRDNATLNLKETKDSLKERLKAQNEQVQERKAELKQEMTKRAEETKQKLEGRRLAKCQNRQATINELMTKSTTISQAKLARIQSYEAAIKKFYEEQALTSESYDSALATADEKETQAIAALEVMSDQTYDCLAADGENPSGEIRALHDTKREALNQYRDSVKELLNVVKSAFAAKKEAA